MSSKPELLIQINTDPACPWCFIGGERLNKVLSSEEFSREVGAYVTPRIEILPYILDPRLTSTSRAPPGDLYESDASTMMFTAGSPPSKDTYYGMKFPMPGQGDAFSEKINSAARELGLGEMKFRGSGAEARVGSTWDAQRLISYAGVAEAEAAAAGLQNRLCKRLYSDFHIDSKDLSDHAVLSRAAVEEGVFADADAARTFLESDEQEAELRRKLQQADMNGVQSVPFYIVNDGADHLSQTGTHDEFMRMFKMASALYR